MVVGIFQSVAQNIQLHYDFGHSMYDEFKDSRAKITTTVEMFKPDKWGSTFFFVDMDYADNEVKSAYWEIARELKFWDGPLSIHAEYNGGLNYIKDSWLAGLTYTYNINPEVTDYGLLITNYVNEIIRRRGYLPLLFY